MTVVVDFSTQEQRSALLEIHRSCFAPELCQELEARLESPRPGDMSFTARVSGLILGHALVERAEVQREGRSWGAPLLKVAAVAPWQQLHGIGSMLLVIAAEEARVDRELAMLAWGTVPWLRRIGFVPAARFGIEVPDGRPDAELMLRPLFRRRRIPEGGRLVLQPGLTTPSAVFPPPHASWAGLRREGA